MKKCLKLDFPGKLPGKIPENSRKPKISQKENSNLELLLYFCSHIDLWCNWQHV